MAKKRSGQVPHGALTQSAPNPLVLTIEFAESGYNQLEWTWSGDDPFVWQWQSSADGLTDWSPIDTADGFERSGIELPIDNKFYRIVGLDPSGSPITPFSNAVQSN